MTVNMRILYLRRENATLTCLRSSISCSNIALNTSDRAANQYHIITMIYTSHMIRVTATTASIVCV